MVDNRRWQLWLAMLRQSDQTLVSIFTMAACAVVLWESMRRLPEPLGQWSRSVYLLALVLFLVWSINFAATTPLAAGFVLMAVLWIGARKWFYPRLPK